MVSIFLRVIIGMEQPMYNVLFTWTINVNVVKVKFNMRMCHKSIIYEWSLLFTKCYLPVLYL